MAHFLNVISLLAWPLAACICIGLLHAYAGLHVLRRGIIFVDLALAQMAALGAVVGALVSAGAHDEVHHHEAAVQITAPAPSNDRNPEDELDAALRAVQPDAPTAQDPDPDEHTEHGGGFLGLWPTLFALGGAILLSFGRVHGERVPHEAIIGVVYVVAAAATVLILSKSPHAHEQMEEMLTGRLLFVDRAAVLSTAGLYAALGGVHWLLRGPFLEISDGVAAGRRTDLSIRLWDCLFYAIFALMVTRSVALGGVLVVFSFLIIPGACASMIATGWTSRILIAWLVAIGVSVLGLALSALGDLPAGSTLVATFGGGLLFAVCGSALLRRPSQRRAGEKGALR
ncbi:MAG: metal ABC transporter permease [Phycisphaerae bacterium]